MAIDVKLIDKLLADYKKPRRHHWRRGIAEAVDQSAAGAGHASRVRRLFVRHPARISVSALKTCCNQMYGVAATVSCSRLRSLSGRSSGSGHATSCRRRGVKASGSAAGRCSATMSRRKEGGWS